MSRNSGLLLDLVLVFVFVATVHSWIISISPTSQSRAARTHLASTLSSRESNEGDVPRREFLGKVAATLVGPTLIPEVTLAETAVGATDQVYKRAQEKFAYTISIPEGFKESQKPVKTHLDEVNFGYEGVRGYQYGITVDPVRINALPEFGKPEEVAARVVTAEVNRDGVFEVTLLNDPYESSDGAYILEYLSEGKRGNKHIFNKIFISNNRLYVLTAQVKQDDFDSKKEELKRIVGSFKV